MSVCSIYNCNQKLKSNGYCGKHYTRWLRHGDPLFTRYNKSDDVVVSELRKCKICKIDKFLSEFYKSNEYYSRECKSCFLEKKRKERRAQGIKSIEQKKAERTHCTGGHELIPENLLANGKCCICNRDWLREYNNWQGNVHAKDREFCPQGHPYNEENTYIVPGLGWRQCKICKNEINRRKRNYRRRFGITANLDRTHCVNGHEFIDENISVGNDGDIVCLPCVRPNKAKNQLIRWGRYKNAKGSFTLTQLESKLEYYGYKCYLCGSEYEQVDHVIPVSRGGSNLPANLRPICRSCNSWKNNKKLGELNVFV